MKPRSDLIVFSKIGVPARRNAVIDRSRLLHDLHVPLTVVFAPPGYGKTTFALQRAQSLGKLIGWVAIDALDNDPARFWLHLAEGLRAVLGQCVIERLQSMFAHSGSDGAGHAVDILLNALSTAVQGLPIVLVLDDFHHVTESSILREFNRFLDFLPAGLQLIICSRVQPTLRLSSRRINASVCLISTEELRFTEDEVHALLAQHQLTGGTLESLQTLLRKADGWVAALQLLCIAVRECRDRFRQMLMPDRVALEFRNGIYALLVDEVFNAQSESVRETLTALAILPRFCIDLANEMLETEEAGHVIKTLVDRNLFVSGIDDEDYWFKFHDLFRSVIYERFSRLHPACRLWHLKAGRWFERHDFMLDALEHFIEGQCWPEVAALLVKSSAQLERERQDVNFRRILARVPNGVLQTYPEIAMAYVLVMPLEEKKRTAANLLATAVEGIHLAPITEVRERVLCVLHNMQIYVSHINFAWHDTVVASRAVLPIAERVMPDMMWPACFALGHEKLMAADWRTAESYFSRGYGHLHKQAYPKSLIILALFYGEILVQRGQLTQAAALADEVKRYMQTVACVYAPLAGLLDTVLARVALERNEMNQLHDYLLALAELEQKQTLDVLQRCWIAWCRFQIGFARGDHLFAGTALDQLDRLLVQVGMVHFYGLGTVPALRAKLEWRCGDREKARQWLDCNGMLWHDQSDVRLGDQLVAARILLGNEREAEALQALENMQTRAISSGAGLLQYECRVLQVMALQSLGQKQEAATRLANLLNMTADQNFARLYINEGATLMPVLDALPDDCMQARYTRNLRKLLKCDARHGEVAVLSQKEREILMRVGQGMSSKEIARELSISPGTVKTHLRNTYRKLQVNGHIQALAKFTNVTEFGH